MLLRPLVVLLVGLSLAFAVTQVQAQQVQLAWDAPLQVNGTAVPNLAGYKLYYGAGTGSVLWERFCLLQSSLMPFESGKFPAQRAAFLAGLKRLRELLGW